MITYELYNVEGEMPQLQKVITVGEERFATNLSYTNTEEPDLIEDTVVTQHTDNLAAYCAWLGSAIEILPIEEAEQSAYPVKNAEELIKLIDTTGRWWQYLYFRNEPEILDTSTGGPIETGSIE